MIPEPVDVDIQKITQSSLLITGFGPLGSETLIAFERTRQNEQKNSGQLIETNLVIYGGGTNVVLADPNTVDVAVSVAESSAAKSPTPIPTPKPTATPTPTPTPPPTPTPSATPSKFGTPSPITSPVPYVITSGTTITTDPAITTNVSPTTARYIGEQKLMVLLQLGLSGRPRRLTRPADSITRSSVPALHSSSPRFNWRVILLFRRQTGRLIWA